MWNSCFSFTLGFFSSDVKCAVLEKSRKFSKHPQAHFVNNRSMEVAFLILKMQFRGVLIISLNVYFFFDVELLLGFPQIEWLGRGDSEVSTACGLLEKVYLLHIALWLYSWVHRPYTTSRCDSCLWFTDMPLRMHLQ